MKYTQQRTFKALQRIVRNDPDIEGVQAAEPCAPFQALLQAEGFTLRCSILKKPTECFTLIGTSRIHGLLYLN